MLRKAHAGPQLSAVVRPRGGSAVQMEPRVRSPTREGGGVGGYPLVNARKACVRVGNVLAKSPWALRAHPLVSVGIARHGQTTPRAIRHVERARRATAWASPGVHGRAGEERSRCSTAEEARPRCPGDTFLTHLQRFLDRRAASLHSSNWLKHIQRSVAALGELTPQMMQALGPGEAFLWASRSTDPRSPAVRYA
jgi:hypothetical protein